MAYNLNSTTYRSDETLCIVGINYNRINYVQFNDLKMGMVFNGNKTNQFFFNIQTTTTLPEIARTTLNLIRENIGKTSQTLLMKLSNTSTTYVYKNNETQIIKLYSPELDNVYIIMNETSGIITNIIIFDGFEYNGAITDPLIQENGSTNLLLLIKSENSQNYCFEDECTNDNIEKAKSIFGFTSDSHLGTFENLVGSTMLGFGVGILMSAACLPYAPALVVGALVIGGVTLLADSHGILSGTASERDIALFSLDVSLACFGSTLTECVTSACINTLTKISVEREVSKGLTYAVKEYKLLNAIQTTSQVCMDTGRDLIISEEVKNFIITTNGWDNYK